MCNCTNFIMYCRYSSVQNFIERQPSHLHKCFQTRIALTRGFHEFLADLAPKMTTCMYNFVAFQGRSGYAEGGMRNNHILSSHFIDEEPETE